MAALLASILFLTDRDLSPETAWISHAEMVTFSKPTLAVTHIQTHLTALSFSSYQKLWSVEVSMARMVKNFLFLTVTDR